MCQLILTACSVFPGGGVFVYLLVDGSLGATGQGLMNVQLGWMQFFDNKVIAPSNICQSSVLTNGGGSHWIGTCSSWIVIVHFFLDTHLSIDCFCRFRVCTRRKLFPRAG